MIANLNIVYSKDRNGIYLSYYDFSLDNPAPVSTNDIIGKTDYDLYPKTIADQHHAQDLIVLQQACSVSYEIQLPDNPWLLQVNKQPLRAANGEIIGIMANVNNSAALVKQSQAEYQAIKTLVKETTGNVAPDTLSKLEYVVYLRDYLKNIIALMPAHVYWYSPDNVLLGCNNLQARNLGLNSAQEIVGKTLYDLLPAEQAQALVDLNMRVMTKGEAHILEEHAVMADGPGVYLSHKVPIRDAQQNVIGVLGISFDITDRKKAEEARLNAVLNAANMGTWVWNFVDNSFIHEYAYHETPYSFKGNLSDAIACAHPADQEQLHATLQQAYKDRTQVEIEYRLRWPDGKMRHIAMRGKIIDNKLGNAYQMIGVSWDITNRKEIEKALQQQQIDLAQIARLNSMGELASTLSHELNQPLSAISSYVKGCLIRLKNGNYQLEDIINVMEQTNVQTARAGEIIHRMKNFIRKGKLYYEKTNLNQVIQEIISVIRLEPAANTVSIHLELTKEVPTLEIDKVQIGQVISNLLRNAIEAIQQNKNITNPQITVKTTLKKNEVWVDVIDNGPGCPSEIITKLFTPYFTTKATGMGMGLAICRTIIEAHHGNLTILPNAKQGAWFRFTLPINKVVTLAQLA
jgi:PAS domain S-box-containing protein